MKTIKKILGYTIAVSYPFIFILAVISYNLYSKKIVDITGLKISPWYSGNIVLKTINHNSYKTQIHKPVFHGFITERKSGFIQIDWVIINKIPDIITENIDFDFDGKIDFNIEYNTLDHKAYLHSLNNNVIGLIGIYKLEGYYAIRIKLKNFKKQNKNH